ncbi:MAG: hypothetical protein AAGD28_10875 [Bacteroidota bacterium]
MEIILCIPGPWNDRTEFLQAVVEQNTGTYIFAGQILLNLETQESFQVELYEADDRLLESFRHALRPDTATEENLQPIAQHKMVAYLIGPGGSFDTAKSMAHAAKALLAAGGLGVKVETAGTAFTPQQWQQMLENGNPVDLYAMYVIDAIGNSTDLLYSCGMHNLGLKDTIVRGLEFQAAYQVLSTFNYYLLLENPDIEENQTFSIAEDAPRFVIKDEVHQPNKGEELFENPFGMWSLNKVDG